MNEKQVRVVEHLRSATLPLPEKIARLIDPEGWALDPNHPDEVVRGWSRDRRGESLIKADMIIALRGVTAQVPRDEISALRGLLDRATQGEWHAGHLIDADHSCGCRYVFSEGHAGGIAEVYVDNGIKSIVDGGNDCPVESEAKANLELIVRAKNALPALLDELEARRQA